MHVFSESLERSHTYADAPWWRDVYSQAFPGFSDMRCMRGDSTAQRDGIDRQVFLRDSRKPIQVDEKVRLEDWDDIALERWSDRERHTKGWVQKRLECDFIAYAFVPSRRCYLLPFQTLHKAWRLNGPAWIEAADEGAPFPKPPSGVHHGRNGFCLVWAENEGYTTESVAVPIPVLMVALTDAMLVRWEAA